MDRATQYYSIEKKAVEMSELFRSSGNATIDEAAVVSGGASPELVMEWGILLGVVLVVSALRTYARWMVNGFRGLSWDDLLVWIAVGFYVFLTVDGECARNPVMP